MSKKRLFEKQLKTLSERLGKDLDYDYLAAYGGYCLTDSTGSRRYSVRMNASQFAVFLDGMALVVDMHKRDNWLTALHDGCKA